MDKSRAVYGIDLGTTYSCIAQVDQFDQAVVLRNFEGDATTPSVVYFEDETNVVVGKEAKGMLETEPDKTVSFIKRDMGNDAAFDKGSNTTPYHLDPSEISAYILKKLVKDAKPVSLPDSMCSLSSTSLQLLQSPTAPRRRNASRFLCMTSVAVHSISRSFS